MLRMVNSVKYPRFFFERCLKLISFDLIFIEKCLLYGAKSPTYPICQFFISKKSVDKSGFVDKSGVDKSEDALYFYLLKIYSNFQKKILQTSSN